jgi:methyl-accepting chemotaxis protein
MKITLGKKLGMGFGVILALMVFTSTTSYLKSANIKRNQDVTFELRYPTLEICRRLQRDLNQTESKGRQVILAATEPDRRDQARKVFDENWGEIEKDVAQLHDFAPRWSLQANSDRLAEVKQHLPLLRAAQESAINHAASGERDAVTKAGNEFARPGDNGHRGY